MITKFEISAGKVESMRFQASDPIRYEPTNERFFTFHFSDNSKMSFSTIIGDNPQRFDLSELTASSNGENLKVKIDEVKEKLIELGHNPVFYLGNINVDNGLIITLR